VKLIIYWKDREDPTKYLAVEDHYMLNGRFLYLLFKNGRAEYIAADKISRAIVVPDRTPDDQSA